MLTIGAAIIFVRSKTKWHSIVNWRCFSPINLFLKKIYCRHLLWKESEFHGESIGVFVFSIYRANKFLWRDLYRYFTCIYYERFLWYGHANNLARLLNEKGKLSVWVENLMAYRLVFLGLSIYRSHKSVLTIGAAIIFVRSKTKWHSIVNFRCFSPINLFLKQIYYRHLLWKESEFHGKSIGVFGFSIYRAHKFLWRDLYRYFTCIYYERFLWYGHANNLARLLNEKGKLSVLVENLMAYRLVFLDYPSTVNTNLCLL